MYTQQRFRARNSEAKRRLKVLADTAIAFYLRLAFILVEQFQTPASLLARRF
jgi:hypothetical protein